MLHQRFATLLSATSAEFQWAPTLGGECYSFIRESILAFRISFNGHPPLGVNATELKTRAKLALSTLVSMGTHPWG